MTDTKWINHAIQIDEIKDISITNHSRIVGGGCSLRIYTKMGSLIMIETTDCHKAKLFKELLHGIQK